MTKEIESTERAGLALPLFTAAVFSGAWLLFLVQPMVAKELLPVLGGTPAVWNTCMLFFQAALLGGYLYAHGLSRIQRRGVAALVHAGALVVALAFLPLASPAGEGPGAGSFPVLWLVGTLLATIGAPFLILSASGPLLQSWFAGLGRGRSRDPYFLFAASNAGSLLALLGYPLLLEPAATLSGQRALWSGGFAVLALLVGGCALLWVRAASASGGEPAAEPEPEAEPPTTRTRLTWVALAFVPSSLMLGVTQHLATEIASFPLIWVIPLAIYLLTFVLAFARTGPWSLKGTRWLVPPMVVVLVTLLSMVVRRPLAPQVAAHLLGLFLLGLACHARLSDSRPDPRHLTGFYLCLSLGGALGGVFNSIVAPLVFDSVIEYPIAIALACVLVHRSKEAELRWSRPKVDDLLVPALLVGVFAGAPSIVGRLGLDSEAGWGLLLRYGMAPLLCLAYVARPLRFQLGVVALLIAPWLGFFDSQELLHEERSFFGVMRVKRQPDGSGAWHHLWHGTTLHGTQYDLEPWNGMATTYFADSGPAGDVVRALEERGGSRRIGLVGLGAGTLAAYGRPAWEMTCFELDPAVARVAGDPAYFTFLSGCESPLDVRLGDARLALAEDEEGAYDLIVLDAFSSDAIPVHLVTREAFSMYMEKLAPGGQIAFHVTNWYLDLAPMVAAIGRELGLEVRLRKDREVTDDERRNKKTYSDWVVVARSAEDLGPIARDERWAEVEVPGDLRVWTDDYSNILAVLRPDE